MFVTRLRAGYWRSWHSVELTTDAQWNVLAGSNGVGKTAILEIMWALHRLRSLRGARVRTMRSHDAAGSDASYASMEWHATDGPHTAYVAFDGLDGMETRLNGDSVSRAELSHRTAVVAIQPQDTDLIFGDSQGRREFIQRIAFSIDPEFLTCLRQYDNVLAQRNSLLREGFQSLRDLRSALQVWDELFVDQSARMQQRINQAFGYVRQQTRSYFDRLLGPMQITLHAGTERDNETESAAPETPDFWRIMLEKSFEKDRRNGYTSVGPHRWDWEARCDGLAARTAASFGQVRSLTIALRLAAADIMAEVLGQAPVVLLDDLNSEIDVDRRTAMLYALLERGYQCWVTTTDARQVCLPASVSVAQWHIADRHIQRCT